MERRGFIKNSVLGSFAVAGLTLPVSSAGKRKPMLKDNFWLWGQTPGSHHAGNHYNLPGVNRMDSREGCSFFGIDRCCRVAMTQGPFPPFDGEAEKIKELKEVVWSAIGAGGVKQHENDKNDLDEVLRMADLYPNVSGAILDDFFSYSEAPGAKIARGSQASIQNMVDRLHGFGKRRLDLWVVWYTHQLHFNVNDYLSLFDVITLWTWKGSDLVNLDSNLRKCLDKTPGKRHLAGVYMWNYGEKKPLTMDQMKYQLERCHYWLTRKKLDGLVFCSNCIADIGLETVEYTRRWISEVGRERI